ncbi:MAG: FliM/FliN family flagellar motor switch protein [Candidatus Sericytochromatia bacterium]|nr:FliM/FliN family flagellar motor switch protein [Candidatus Sericytochromatia bacterium]
MTQRQTVNPVRFAPLSGGGVDTEPNYELLRDLKLEVLVELGRTSIPLRQVLQLGEGTIIELEQLAGEAVNLTIAGKIVATGEVVVIGTTFGIKVTQVFHRELAGVASGA